MSVNTDQKIIKNKVGLLKLADMLGSVSEACKVMGYSRDSFYRFTLMRSRLRWGGVVKLFPSG
jgi:molybdenum-dependent DNA-binding transcriptional regulator ModE